jgi:hypothetical protein
LIIIDKRRRVHEQQLNARSGCMKNVLLSGDSSYYFREILICN